MVSMIRDEGRVLTQPDIPHTEPKMGKVAVIYTTPETVIEDYARLMDRTSREDYKAQGDERRKGPTPSGVYLLQNRNASRLWGSFQVALEQLHHFVCSSMPPVDVTAQFNSGLSRALECKNPLKKCDFTNVCRS